MVSDLQTAGCAVFVSNSSCIKPVRNFESKNTYFLYFLWKMLQFDTISTRPLQSGSYDSLNGNHQCNLAATTVQMAISSASAQLRQFK